MSGCVVIVLEAGHSIRLLAFLPLDNVELDFVTFFERFEPPPIESLSSGRIHLSRLPVR